jgi:tryptophan synthase alpha chain
MSRIAETFARLRQGGNSALIPFVVAGDPDIRTTLELLIEMARAGASLIELGIPFSDPMADGPVIQRASMRALRNGVGVAEVLKLVAEARKQIDVPLVLFSYFNPLLRFGVKRLSLEARRAGADAILVTDLVPEEAEEFSARLAQNELDSIFLVAPTTSDRRLRMIAQRARGFIYVVSRAGVTGARVELSTEAEPLVARVRAVSDLPVAVGFGISSARQVTEVLRYADAAVVGSAIVAEMERLTGAPDIVHRIGSFTRDLFPPRVEE